MSIEIGSKQTLIPTDLGTMCIHETICFGHDVEDIVQDRAISQARLIQMINAAKNTDPNTSMPSGVARSDLLKAVQSE